MTMRTQTRLRRFIPLLAIAALLAGVTGPVFAQETRKETSPYDLEIKDGLLVWSGPPRKDNAKQLPANLQNVVALLRELHPEANFAVSPRVAGTDIADLKMRTSSVEEKLEAVRIASGSEFLWNKAQATPMQPDAGQLVMSGGKAILTLYVLDALQTTAKSGLQVEAFNVNTYIKAFNTYPSPGKPEDAKEENPQERVEQIKRMALETVNDYETVSMTLNKSKARSLRSPSIRFHPGANLLVIIGEPEAVAVAAKVIGALPGAQRSVASEGSDDPSAKIDAMLNKLESDRFRPTPRR